MFNTTYLVFITCWFLYIFLWWLIIIFIYFGAITTCIGILTFIFFRSLFLLLFFFTTRCRWTFSLWFYCNYFVLLVCLLTFLTTTYSKICNLEIWKHRVILFVLCGKNLSIHHCNKQQKQEVSALYFNVCFVLISIRLIEHFQGEKHQ